MILPVGNPASHFLVARRQFVEEFGDPVEFFQGDPARLFSSLQVLHARDLRRADTQGARERTCSAVWRGIQLVGQPAFDFVLRV